MRTRLVIVPAVVLVFVAVARLATASVVARVSVSGAGAQATGASTTSPARALSGDGLVVAFQSRAADLVPGDTNGTTDVFVHERSTGATTRVSVSSLGGQATGSSVSPALSADGRFVAFSSSASNLVPGDTNGVPDVFVHDRATGTTTRVSVASDGTQANDRSLTAGISADGRLVVYRSAATNLVPGDTNGIFDVFVHDRTTGVTARASVASDGSESDADSLMPTISADGGWVAFESSATTLVAGDTNFSSDIFVRDLAAGTTTRVSLDSAGGQGNGHSFMAALSADGRFVAFQSSAENLVAGDANFAPDVFVHDRQTGATTRASVAPDGSGADDRSFTPALSGDGRLVAFQSVATNLVAGDGNGVPDVFVRDLASGITRCATCGADGASSNPTLSADGAVLLFTSSASNLVGGDTNSLDDVFVRAAACGDGVLDASEACDDADLDDGDGCDSNCTSTGCGNGVVTAGEACDDGNVIDGDGCEADCTVTPDGCTPGAIRYGSIRIQELGVPARDELVVFRGRIDVPDVARTLPQADVHLWIEDVGADRVIWELTREASSGVSPGGGCGGWKSRVRGRKQTYRRCAPASDGVLMVRIVDRRARNGAIDFVVTARAPMAGMPVGPLRGGFALVTAGDTGADGCEAFVFEPETCRLDRRMMTCR
jgi:cysteine-rich repeat protein